MPLVQLEPTTREHGNGVALHFSRLVPTAWSIGDQIVNIQASWNLCDVPWELLIPALSVLFEDTSHQEWRGGLEAKYHSAEPWRLNSRRVQVTQQMERSATRSSSPIRLCFAHVSH